VNSNIRRKGGEGEEKDNLLKLLKLKDCDEDDDEAMKQQKGDAESE
jgi:hypothetical protein